MAELDFISKFSGEEIDNILDKSQELLNKGYTFSGVATPETDPGTPSLKVFYLTTTAGKYANFDNITVESGKLTVLLYNGSMWQNQVLDLPKEANVVQTVGNSTSDVMSQDAVTEELSKKASVESVTDGISAHNTSSTSHADIRKLLNTCVGLPAYDSSSYKITFTTLAGASVEIDLPIEQLALRYNAETESIEFDNADGTTTSIPVSAFVKEYVGSIGDRIQISIDENNVIHATVLKNSIDWDCLSVDLQARINDHVTSVDFATKVVRTDIAQSLSLAAQNQALENIGADLMIIDLVNGLATLTDEQEARLLSCNGVILRGTVNASNEVFTKIYFSDYQGGDVVAFYAVRSYVSCLRCTYTKSTKIFRFIGGVGWSNPTYVSTGSSQNFSMSEQAQAFANLGMKVYVTDSSFSGSTLSAEEIEEVYVSKAILFADTGDLFLFGSADNNRISFYRLINEYYIGAITVSKSSGVVSGIGTYAYQDKNALHFTAQNPALTSAQQDVALSNIGLKWVNVPYSLLNTTLDDATYAKIKNANGLILTDASSEYYGPLEFICGANNSDGVKVFSGLNLADTSAYIALRPDHSLTNVRYLRTYNGAVPYDASKTLTSDQQDVALSNIGLNFVHVDYSLLGTTLSDANFNKIWNAKGLVISGNDSIPMIFIRGRSNSEQTGFYAFRDSSTMVYMALLASTKKLNLLTSWSFNSGSVIYNATQTLTDTQKQQARTNIGVQSADELIEDADFIAQLKTKLGIA